MPASQTSCSQPLYAVIDLGSNSFHMLITRLVADSVQVVDKVKRKVRLAAGLDSENVLDTKSMARGWECLNLFAERLENIPPENIKIVATATLRLAKNSAQFIKVAETILGHKIHLISGEEEAHNIYLGVAHTTSSADRRLVIDIGGASTELIVGSGFSAKKVCSLNMGCVTFHSAFFNEGDLTEETFSQAIAEAQRMLQTEAQAYKDIGWDVALGVSGTLQAVGEVLTAQGKIQKITLDNLIEIKHQIISCKHLNKLNIIGLENERKPVFASGIAILIGIFLTLEVDEIQLAGGAIREGLLYEILPDMRNVNIRQRTIDALIKRFSIDVPHATLVANLSSMLFEQVVDSWSLNEDLYDMLRAASDLHEIGLLLEFKGNKKHAQYIISQTDLPGFSASQRSLLVALIGNYKTDINHQIIHDQYHCEHEKSICLMALLRVAVILSKHRKDSVTPKVLTHAHGKHFSLEIPEYWLAKHPLIAAELQQEIEFCKELSIDLTIHLT